MAVFEEHQQRTREPFFQLAHYREARPSLAGVERYGRRLWARYVLGLAGHCSQVTA